MGESREYRSVWRAVSPRREGYELGGERALELHSMVSNPAGDQMGGKPGRQVLGIKSRRWGVVWGFVCHVRGGFRRLEKKLHGQSQRLLEQDH